MPNSILNALIALLTSFITAGAPADDQQGTRHEPPKAAASADDEKVALKDVPKVVLDAVKAIYPAGVILDETEKDVDHDETTYEVALMNHGKRFKVEVGSEGAINEIEGEVDPADLPKPVADALSNRYPDGVTTSAEEHVDIDRKREIKVFEVVVVADGTPLEIAIRPDGVIEDVDD